MGVSRQCAHRWVARDRAGGHDGLVERASRAHRSPTGTPAAVERQVLRPRQPHVAGLTSRVDHARNPAPTRIADRGKDITWTVADHKIIVTTPDQVVVPFVYTCGTRASPASVQYDPGVFQTVYLDDTAAACTDPDGTLDYPTFTCDVTQHTTTVVLTAREGTSFENGNIEVALVEADAGSTMNPTFEHAIIGYDQLHDTRAEVAVTVNATPESTKAGSKITVKGTVKRDGKASKGKDATLSFQSKAGDPATKIGSATADSEGNLSIKVTATGPGTYFWTTTSTSKTQAGASLVGYAAAA